MRRIAHLADLHFGAEDRDSLEPLRATLDALAPDVVVIAGDLTQRARTDQFQAARAFLDRLATRPLISVPGNHDIALWNLLRRFGAPRRRFDRYITPESHPHYLDDEIAVVGLNTARSFTLANGCINLRQIQALRACFAQAGPGARRIVVAHHPFVVPEDVPVSARVGRADLALPLFADLGVDLLLTGHRHLSWIGRIASASGRASLVVHAGTATSWRARGEPNSFNEVIVQPDAIDVVRYAWRPPAPRFEPVAEAPVRREDAPAR